MANFLSNMFGGVENFFGINRKKQPLPQQPQQPLPPPSFNVATLKPNQDSLRQQALPQVQRPQPVAQQPQQPKPVQPRPQNPQPQIQAGGMQRPAPLPAPSTNLSPFLSNLVHGGLEVPQHATATMHDAKGNVLGWQDAQGSHLTTYGKMQAPPLPHQEGSNLIQKAVNAVFPNVEKTVNTAAAGVSGLGSAGRVAVAAITHNRAAENNALNEANAGMNTFLEKGHGVGGEGGFFHNAQEAANATPLDIAKKSVGGGAGVASEVLPFFVGAEGGAAAKAGGGFVKNGVKTIATGAGLSAGTTAASDLADKGKIDPKDVFRSALVGGATAGVVHGAVSGFKAAAPKIAEISGHVRDELSKHLSGDPEWGQALSNHFAGKDAQQITLEHLATNDNDLNGALNHTAANIISSMPGVAENHVAAAAIRKSPALGNVLKHAVTGDEVGLEHALRDVLPGADEQVIQTAKTHLLGEEKPLVTAPTPKAAQAQEQKLAEQGAHQEAQQAAQDAEAKAQQAAADAQNKAGVEAAQQPRALTTAEVQALADNPKTTDVYKTIRQANPTITHKEATQIAHDVTRLNDPAEVSAYLNSKGVLADNSHEIANGTAPAEQLSNDLTANNNVQTGTPAPDNAKTEATLGQTAAADGKQTTSPDIAQNKVFDRNDPEVSAKVQEMITSGERKAALDKIKHDNPGISSLDASRKFTQQIADQMTADAAKHPLEKTAENIVAGQRAKGHTVVTDALIADKKAAGIPLTPEEIQHEEATALANNARTIAEAEKARAAKAPTTRAYGKDIEMSAENGYQATKTADGGTVYSKTAMSGSNTKGDRAARTSYYSSDGSKITQAQHDAMVDGRLSSTPFKNNGTEPATPAPKVTPDPAKAATAADNLANPTTGKLAPNTTALRILSDENVPEESKTAINNLFHEVHNQKVMEENAKTLVENDGKSAQDLFDSRNLPPDSHFKLGNALVDKYNAEGNDAKAGEVYDDMIRTASTGGQTLRAVQGISKISPQGITKYAENLAGKAGKQLDPAIKAQLVQAAKEIAKMPEGKMKATAIKNMVDLAKNKTLFEKSGDYASGILSIPRALMATGDLSFGGRQGAVLGALHPVQWVKANIHGARMAVDSKFFEESMNKVANMTDKNGESLNPVFKKMGVDLTGVARQHEETYGDVSILESKTAKKFGVGHVVAGSDRAYTGAATELRAGVIQDFVNKMGGVKGLESWTEKDFKDFGRVINTATGRGQGGKAFEAAAPTLGKTLFSARLWKSRLDLLNPVYYARLAPAARAEALKSSTAFAGLVGVVLAAAAAAGADVETDPRSSDFGKIKIGNTRYDVMGGLQQNIVLASREVTGEKMKSDGTIEKLDGTFGHGSRTGVLKDFVDNKTTPVLNTAMQLGSGKDMGGNPVNPWTSVAKLFIPLGAQDVNSLIQDHNGNQQGTQSVKQAAQNYLNPKNDAKSVAMSLPGFGGAGVQTYPSSTSPQVGKTDPSTLSPADLTKYEKNVTTDFTKGLSPADKTIYDLSKNKDAARFAMRNGKVTQDQLDAMTVRENQARDKAGLPINYIQGITDDQYKASDPEMQAVIKQASLQGASKFAKANINPDSQKLIEEAAKNAWPGIGDIKPTNQMALDYIKMQKTIADKPGDQAAAYEAQRGFWRGVVKTQYSDAVAQMYEDNNPDTTNETSKGYGMSIADIKRLASGVSLNGKSYQLTQTDLDKMVELDNRLLTSGLIDTPKFSNSTRKTLGYGSAPGVGDGSIGYHGSKGSGGGGGSGGTATADMHSANYVTDFGNSGGGASPFLTQASKPAAAPKVDLSKFKAGSSSQKKITVNL